MTKGKACLILPARGRKPHYWSELPRSIRTTRLARRKTACVSRLVVIRVVMHFFDEDCCARLLRVAASERVSPLETTIAAAPCCRTSATLDLRNRIRPGVAQIRCLQLRNVAELVRKLREALERRCSFAAREVESRRKYAHFCC